MNPVETFVKASDLKIGDFVLGCGRPGIREFDDWNGVLIDEVVVDEPWVALRIRSWGSDFHYYGTDLEFKVRRDKDQFRVRTLCRMIAVDDGGCFMVLPAWNWKLAVFVPSLPPKYADYMGLPQRFYAIVNLKAETVDDLFPLEWTE